MKAVRVEDRVITSSSGTANEAQQSFFLSLKWDKTSHLHKGEHGSPSITGVAEEKSEGDGVRKKGRERLLGMVRQSQ